MKLLFKVDGIVNGVVEFKAGEVYEISEELGSAARWIKRGAVPVLDESVAEVVLDETVAIPEVKVENKKSEKSHKKEK